MSSFTITGLQNVSEDSEIKSAYEDLLDQLNEAIYDWHGNISSEIEENKYINDLEDLNIEIKTYSNFAVSLILHQETICQDSGIVYSKETEAKYSLLDIYGVIDNLVNKDKKIKKGALIIFSIALLKTLERNKKFTLNINQITNKMHPIISMIFCNEMHKHIRELGFNQSTKLILDNLTDILDRKIKEEYIII